MPKVSSPSSPTLRGKGGGGQSNSSHMRCLSERVLELESRLKTPAAARSGLYRSIARALDSSTAARTLSSPFAGAAPKASPDLPPSIAAGATLATNLAPNWRRSGESGHICAPCGLSPSPGAKRHRQLHGTHHGETRHSSQIARSTSRPLWTSRQTHRSPQLLPGAPDQPLRARAARGLTRPRPEGGEAEPRLKTASSR